MRRTIAVIIGAILVTGPLSATKLHTALDQQEATRKVVAAEKKGSFTATRTPGKFVIPDCENQSDTDQRMCVSFDDGKWYVVTNFDPFQRHSTKKCGKRKSKCIETRKDGEYNYYIR